MDFKLTAIVATLIAIGVAAGFYFGYGAGEAKGFGYGYRQARADLTAYVEHAEEDIEGLFKAIEEQNPTYVGDPKWEAVQRAATANRLHLLKRGTDLE